MNEFLNWATTLAYFAVFIIGLITCFKEARSAWLCRRLDCISIHDKRSYTFKAIANSAITFLGILGLIQAFVGV